MPRPAWQELRSLLTLTPEISSKSDCSRRVIALHHQCA